MSLQEIACPDIGDFKDVLVIDVLVKSGDQIRVDAPLITLETDKATMDVPATVAGRIVDVLVVRGDKVSKGTKLVRVETLAEAALNLASAGTPTPASSPAPSPAATTRDSFLSRGAARNRR